MIKINKIKFSDKMMKKGYIAITTSIFLSLVTMVVAIIFAASTFLTRFNYVDFESKRVSYSLARSCLNYGLLKLADNGNYSGNETINVSSGQCAVRPILTSGSDKIIEAHAQTSQSTTNLRLTVNSITLSTVSLEEIVKF